MERDNKPMLSDFVYGEKFELNTYLTYLFNHFYEYVSDQSEDKLVKQ